MAMAPRALTEVAADRKLTSERPGGAGSAAAAGAGLSSGAVGPAGAWSSGVGAGDAMISPRPGA